MTSREIKLYSQLLLERYGEVCEAVGTYLMKQLVPQTLPVITKAVGLYAADVRHSLAVLLKQNIAECSTNSKGAIQFKVRCEKISPLLIHPHCVQYVKRRFGDYAEMLMIEMLSEPGISMSEYIERVAEILHNQTDEDYTVPKLTEIKEAFIQLARNKLIYRCNRMDMLEEEKKPIHEHHTFAIPEIQLQLLQKIGNCDSNDGPEPGPPPAKKGKFSKVKFPDKDIYWNIDTDRFFIHLRNDAIINAATHIVDEKGASIVRAIVERSELAQFADNKQWTPTTPPVTYYEVLNHLKPMDGKELELYLSVLSDGEFQFVSKVDDRSGGVYVMNTKKIVSKLTECAASDVVKEKFGSKYSRIFRLLIKEKYLETKQIGDYCMIPTKVVETHAYELRDYSYISMKAIAKTPDYSPKKSIHLFYVDLMAVSRMLLQTCFHSLYNTLCFTDVYRKNNSRLVDKKMKVDAIIATLEQSGADPEQVEEVAQMITPLEKETLEDVEKSCVKLNWHTNKLVEMAILLKSYLRLATSK